MSMIGIGIQFKFENATFRRHDRKKSSNVSKV